MENNNERFDNTSSDDKNENIDIQKDNAQQSFVEGETFVMMTNTEADKEEKEESYVMGDKENSNGGASMYNHYNYNPNNENTYKNYAESQQKPKKRSGRFKKIIAYILVGLICTTLGGAASVAATLYVLPKTEMFKETELYKTIAGDISNTSPVYQYQPASFASEKDALTVAEVARKVGPAVVAVTTKSKGAVDFFGRSGVQQGVGSGMIINEEGYILTNYHVVQGAQEVKVILSTGKEVNAKIVNYDADYDVAVVKITDSIKVPAVVELGESKSLQVGEGVVAIGNPLGKEFLGSVTTGVVSALNRNISSENKELSYIQTDAAINSGNSGGPLINTRGQVIGINTAKIKDSGVEGLGFAIPIDAVKDKIQDLSRPILMIGIAGREVTEADSKQYNIPVGVYIQEVVEYGPAEKAGIKPGDIIVKVDGEKVKTFTEINRIKNKHKAGDTIKIVVNRDGKERELELKLTEQ